jgi:DNA (cytosine-5)-methyltransferase 1
MRQAISECSLNELALFAGAGGGILGGKLLGWTTVCAVEYNAYARSVLLARQNDGTLAPFPIWDDVRTFDGKPWRGIVDVVSGGFPCQDISAAGKGAGIDGERSGLWGEMARIIREVQPRFVFVENSPILTSRGLGRVLGDLAEMGFDAEWGVVSAADTGAPHIRERIWIVAYPMCHGQLGQAAAGVDPYNSERSSETHRQIRCHVANATKPGNQNVADSMRTGLSVAYEYGDCSSAPDGKHARRELVRADATRNRNDWPTEPGVGRVVDGLAHRMDRIKALGNGQVSRVAATAWNLLKC